jgi:hypothetical protein
MVLLDIALDRQKSGSESAFLFYLPCRLAQASAITVRNRSRFQTVCKNTHCTDTLYKSPYNWSQAVPRTVQQCSIHCKNCNEGMNEHDEVRWEQVQKRVRILGESVQTSVKHTK